MYTKVSLGLNAIFIVFSAYIYFENLQLSARVSLLEAALNSSAPIESVGIKHSTTEVGITVAELDNRPRGSAKNNSAVHEDINIDRHSNLNDSTSEDTTVLIDDREEVLNVHLEGKGLLEIPEQFLPPEEDIIRHQQQAQKEALSQ